MSGSSEEEEDAFAEELRLEDFFSDDEEDAHPEDEVTLEEIRDSKYHFLARCVLINNLPKVSEAKIEKLKGVVMKKVFKPLKIAAELADFYMPLNSDEVNKKGEVTTSGFCFVVTESPEFAKRLITKANGFKFAKGNLSVHSIEDAERFLGAADDFTEPEIAKFKPWLKSVERWNRNPRHWLLDTRGRDQFVIRHSSETEVWWADGPRPAVPCYSGEGQKALGANRSWCEMHVVWSPQGTYLATMHDKGFAVWGGPCGKKQESLFSRIGRCKHKGVARVLFSPGEKYIVSWNGSIGPSPRPGSAEANAIKVFDATDLTELRSFEYNMGAPPNVIPFFLDNDGVSAMARWPVMTFSANDGFFAMTQKKDLLAIYDAKTCKLHKPQGSARGKSIQVQGLEDFSWSPDPESAIVAFWAPERANIPAKVQLLSMPDRSVVREKLWYQVSDIQFHWHPNGDFLAVRVKRHTKTRKTYYTSIEIFRMKDQNIPVETFEIREHVLDFCWEPTGARFGVVHSTQETRSSVSFYDLHGVSKAKGCDLLFTLTDRECNTLSWQPTGGIVVLLGAGSPHNGRLEFYSVDDDEVLMEAEHYMCSKVVWDPSGRSVASVVTQRLGGAASLRGSSEAGYFLWTQHGVIIERVQKQKFYQFMWRPRPRTLLTAKQRKVVAKPRTMKKFSKRYGKQDTLRLDAHGAENAKKQVVVRDAFRAKVADMRARVAPRRAELVALLGFDVEDDANYKIVNQKVNVILDQKEIEFNPES